MTQKKGIYKILDYSIIYEFVQKIFYHKKTKEVWENLVKHHADKTILDIGCGPGKTALEFKGSKKYIGIDISDQYIIDAKKNFSEFGEFYCISVEKINEGPLKDINNIDMVIMKGIFHHLSDDQIDNLFLNLKTKLNKKAKIFSIDPTLIEGKFLSNFIVSRDRGMVVRSSDQLTNTLSKYMKIEKKEVIMQKFPPYQRILLRLG